MQLPGRNVLLSGGILTLFATMMITSSFYLTQFDRQRNPAGRQEILGTISLQGLPLPHGRVQFLCQLTDGDVVGVDAEAPIVNGRFHLPKADGPSPGWYIIRILLGDEPALEPGAERPIEVVRDCERRVVSFPTGTDLFVRLHRRKLHRFMIDLHHPSQIDPATQRGDEPGLAASPSASQLPNQTLSAMAFACLLN